MLDHKNILVIGDVMLDIYYTGEVNRISPEAPVPVFKKLNERCVLGGASNVVANLAAAGQKASVLAMIGKDRDGDRIRELFKEIGVNNSLLATWNRPTITKTRFLAENNQQVLRLDIEDNQPITNDEATSLLQQLNSVIDQFDLILISDYIKGLLTYEFTQGIINIAREHGKKVLVDVKDARFEKYKGAWLLKPNKKELHDLTKMPVSTDDELISAARYLLQKSECSYILTTCGSKGMVLVGPDIVYHLDTVGKSVYDVTGAGDTTIAYLTAALASGINIQDAMNIANHAAGIQVGKVGTSAVYLHEVEEAMTSKSSYRKQKIFRLNERNDLKKLIAEWKHNGETIVTTNGCFDIIHRGHISLLEEAKSYGDHLIVMINTDKSVKRLKGAGRPINTEEDRAMVIAALDCVDAVALFDPLSDNKTIPDEDIAGMSFELKKTALEAPMALLKLIAPDIHAKGGDYSVDQVPEAIYAKEYRAVPFIHGYSTTRTIEKSRQM
ncbi:MAG: bifunctional heptose 7-phosphate kinase/heptose 1-phosphate adenyltransferase [Lachnospiraceae bacterium]|nr:bifunctional heptose 7-phosphate kinase/heptose 1-phosphate adenyltransferase [Lachnospiraceae bacterium]